MRTFQFLVYILVCTGILCMSSCKSGKDTEDAQPLTIKQISPSSGKAGIAVTISGTNFSTVASQNEVKFNGKLAVVTSATATELVVTVPQGAGKGPVSVQIGATSVTGPVFDYLVVPMVGTLAGSGTSGYNDGQSISSQFRDLNGIAVDKSGNVYVADYADHRIRKITPAGFVTTLAGNGEDGFVDGPASISKFSNPMGVAVDKEGNVYVADHGNNRIRKISSAGQVTTLAGEGSEGFADGDGTSAKFNHPGSVAVDEAGNVFVADFFNNRIRKITPQGMVSTYAGTGAEGAVDGPAATAQFWQPIGVSVDKNGNIYVADRENCRVRKITSSGQVSTIAGGQWGFADGAALAAKFDRPTSVVIDEEGVLYVADRWNNRIRKVSPDGTVSTFAGTGIAGFKDDIADAAQFREPVSLAVDAEGNIYVAESQNYRIRKINTK